MITGFDLSKTKKYTTEVRHKVRERILKSWRLGTPAHLIASEMNDEGFVTPRGGLINKAFIQNQVQSIKNLMAQRQVKLQAVTKINSNVTKKIINRKPPVFNDTVQLLKTLVVNERLTDTQLGGIVRSLITT